MIILKTIAFFSGVLFSLQTMGQIHCGLVEITPNTTESGLLTFDNFTAYNGGVVWSNLARIRVVVEDQAVPDPLCSWSLRMIVDNNASSGTPGAEWEELAQYGMGNGVNPPVDALEIRVRNSCQTSPIDGGFQTFSANADIIDIIAPLLPVQPAGTCTTNVNGVGSYLSNYDEFTFSIDVRVKPEFAYNPGIYQLNVRFRLEENP